MGITNISCEPSFKMSARISASESQ